MPIGTKLKWHTQPYKGLTGSYGEEDGKVVIVVLDIPDTIIGECATTADAQTAFEGLVDDYLDTKREVDGEAQQ